MKNRIENTLEGAFCPTLLEVVDESHLHAGHAHAKAEGSHMAVTVVSTAFEGLTRIQRHKAIYQALNTVLNPADGSEGLHALRMNLYTPEEWKQKNG